MIVNLERKILSINNKMGWNRDAKTVEDIPDQGLRYTEIVVKNMKILTSNLTRLENLKKKFEQMSDKKQEDALQKEIKRIQTENKLKLENCQKLLKVMNKSDEESDTKDPTLRRMEKMRVTALQVKLYTLIKQSGKMEMEIKEITKIKLFKWITLMDKGVRFEEVDEYMNDPSKMGNLMQKFYGGKSMKLDNALRDMEERVREMREINEGIKKLVGLIGELGDIIKGNTELLNSIDANMEDVKNYVAEGVEFLEEGKKEMDSAGNKFCCLFVVILIIMIFAVNYLLKKVGM
jgi:t-SNARE complex subunit (syntaxin)